MRIRCLLFFLLCGFVASAQTIEVSGLQAGEWSADTVLITGDVIIQDTLDILPGTTVVFQDYYGFDVRKGATFRATGNVNDSIRFTVIDTTGFHIFNSGRGGWNGIRADMAADVKLVYCRLQYGKASRDEEQDGGALCLKKCDRVEISHSTLFCNFSREHGGALNAERSKVVMHDCDVLNNLTYTGLDTVYFMYGGGLRFINCDVEITQTDFRYNYGQNAIGGALSLDSCAVKIDRCKFEYNYGINGGGLYLIRSNDWECSITNSLFANNFSGHFGGGLAISDSSPLVSNLTVVNNHSFGVNCGGIFFYQNSSPLIRNCIVYGNTNEAPIEEPVQMWAWTYDEYAPEFHNCLIQYGLDNISNHEVITVYEDCLDSDPRFVNPEDEDFHLTPDSPCIDAGLTYESDVYEYDLDGLSRVYYGIIDIGAYEFCYLSINERNQNKNNIHIVGNPILATSYAEFLLEKASPVEVLIYSMDGRLMYNDRQGQCQAGENRIEIGGMFQNLTKGFYLLVVKTTDKTLISKVIN